MFTPGREGAGDSCGPPHPSGFLGAGGSTGQTGGAPPRPDRRSADWRSGSGSERRNQSGGGFGPGGADTRPTLEQQRTRLNVCSPVVREVWSVLDLLMGFSLVRPHWARSDRATRTTSWTSRKSCSSSGKCQCAWKSWEIHFRTSGLLLVSSH